LEPLTPDDFEIIEKNCNFIEEQLLNQVGVFYDRQRFIITMNDGGVTVRLISKIGRQSNITGSQIAKCFYLTVDSELHIAPKLRPKTKKQGEDEEKEEETEPEILKKAETFKPISFRV
jgi:Peroxisome biogenesis factor 1, N-terminal